MTSITSTMHSGDGNTMHSEYNKITLLYECTGFNGRIFFYYY